jgi:ubiquitin C-terminal hydrolase
MLFSVGSFISDLESFYTTIRMASSPGVLMPLTENFLDLARRMKILHSDHAIESSSADPSKLKKAVDNATDKFKGFQQRDAHEFAATFIDLLHEEAIAASQGGVVPTDTHFLMKVQVCLTCDSCGYSR